MSRDGDPLRAGWGRVKVGKDVEIEKCNNGWMDYDIINDNNDDDANDDNDDDDHNDHYNHHGT